MSRIISQPLKPAKKGKGKKKQKPKGPYSLWRKKEADKMWSLAVRLRDGRCLICGKVGLPRKSDGLRVKGLDAHHLVGRSNLNYRFDLENGITLCKYHHNCDDHIAAHGANDVTARFMDWLGSTEHILWFEDNRDYRHAAKPNYLDEYNRLKVIVDELKKGTL